MPEASHNIEIIRSEIAWWLEMLGKEALTELDERKIAKFHEVCGDKVPSVDLFFEACHTAMKLA